MREAEAILYDEFKAATRVDRARAQKSWLSMHAARLKAEIDVHEAERLLSESLPVDEVKKLWASALQTYRNELEFIPSKWAVFLFEKEQ